MYKRTPKMWQKLVFTVPHNETRARTHTKRGTHKDSKKKRTHKKVMLRTRVVSFSVGFASASAIGLYKLNQDIEKSKQILLKQVENAEKRLKFLEEEFAKMKA